MYLCDRALPDFGVRKHKLTRFTWSVAGVARRLLTFLARPRKEGRARVKDMGNTRVQGHGLHLLGEVISGDRGQPGGWSLFLRGQEK